MDAAPAGISKADWLAWPASARALIRTQQEETLALRQENEQLRAQLTALATELASLRERIGRSSRNSSKPPSSDGPGHRCAEGFAYKPPERTSFLTQGEIWSTNPLERLNKEIKRRTNVVGIFPNDAAITLLVGSQLLEQQEEWQLERRRFFSEATMAKIPEPEEPLVLSETDPAASTAACIR